MIPVIISFLIALIPTLKFQWPLSWDIIFHIQYAHFYSQYGFSLDKNYPPLFHFIILSIGNTFNVDYFQVARFLQPILAASFVFSVSYVARKLYGNIAGVCAGFLVVSSYIAFRIFMPLPENLAFIFMIFSIYIYYESISQKNFKYALLSGVLFILALLTHRTVPLILIVVITLFTLLELFLYRNRSIFKNYILFLSLPLILGVALIALFLIIAPDSLSKLIQQVTSTYTIYLTSYINLSAYNRSISILKYISFLGIFVSLFSLIGFIVSIKNRSKKGIFILTWFIIIFLISNVQWIGFNIESARFIIYMLIPLSIIGGYGLTYVFFKLKDYPRFSSLNFRLIFLLCVFGLSVFFGLLTATEKSYVFNAKDSIGNIQIAPPTASEADLANWFKQNGQNSTIIISNYYTGTFVSAYANINVISNFGSYNKNSPKSMFDKKNISYIVYDKRLTFPSKNGTFHREESISELKKPSKVFYYSGDIKSNLNKIVPPFGRVVYENSDFIVVKV